jgi:hypothetical protein
MLNLFQHLMRLDSDNACELFVGIFVWGGFGLCGLGLCRKVLSSAHWPRGPSPFLMMCFVSSMESRRAAPYGIATTCEASMSTLKKINNPRIKDQNGLGKKRFRPRG